MTTDDDAAGLGAGLAHPWVDPDTARTTDPLDRDRYRARCGCGWHAERWRRVRGMAAHDYAQHEQAARRALRQGGGEGGA